MKNCIYFNIQIDSEYNIYYYTMLYYALSTLFKYYDNSFDIVIFQSMPDNFDFDKYQYMSKYSIKNDFNNLHIYESDYKSKI